MPTRMFSKTSLTLGCAVSLAAFAKCHYHKTYRQYHAFQALPSRSSVDLLRQLCPKRHTQCEPLSTTSSLNSHDPKDSSINLRQLQDALKYFYSQYAIPEWSHAEWVATNNGQCTKIRLNLPQQNNLNKVLTRVLDFRAMRRPWHYGLGCTSRYTHQQRRILRERISEDETRLRAILNLGSSISPFIMDFYFKKNTSKDASSQENIPATVRVEIYREHHMLDDNDVEAVKLLLYLAHNLIPPNATDTGDDFFKDSIDDPSQNPLDLDNPSFGMNTHLLPSISHQLGYDPFLHFKRLFFNHPFIGAFNNDEHFFLTTTEHESHNPSGYGTNFYSREVDGLQGFTQQSTKMNQATLNHQIKKRLENMGALVFLPSDKKNEQVDWSSLPGYDEAKRVIEETILLTFSHANEFEKLTQVTRSVKGDTNCPRMILFNGPPGTGKTTTSRLIAYSTQLPLIYIPLESFLSKWFGESEKNIGIIFDLAKTLGKTYNGCILFIDEIDSLASSRDDYTLHEASKRILSSLLRRLDGFDTQQDKTILICATNREKDLDEAFRSRIDVTVLFALPSRKEREMIIQRYAKHLSPKDLKLLACETEGLSGRNIRDFCCKAERSWLAQLIKEKKLGPSDHSHSRGSATTPPPPPLEFYVKAAKEKSRQQS